jgi:hypothetical protein
VDSFPAPIEDTYGYKGRWNKNGAMAGHLADSYKHVPGIQTLITQKNLISYAISINFRNYHIIDNWHRITRVRSYLIEHTRQIANGIAMVVYSIEEHSDKDKFYEKLKTQRPYNIRSIEEFNQWSQTIEDSVDTTDQLPVNYEAILDNFYSTLFYLRRVSGDPYFDQTFEKFLITQLDTNKSRTTCFNQPKGYKTEDINDEIKTVSRVNHWICKNHEIHLMGMPHMHIAIIKDQEVDPTATCRQITQNVSEILSEVFNKEVDVKTTNNYSPTNPSCTWINYCLKYTESKYVNEQLKGEPVARTVFTLEGKDLLENWKNLFEAYRKFKPSVQKVCCSLELEVSLRVEDILNTAPTEQITKVQTMVLIQQHLTKHGFFVNNDGYIWKHKHGTKMTYEDQFVWKNKRREKLTIEQYVDSALLEIVVKNLDDRKSFIINGLKSSRIDGFLGTYPIPRISMSYRMIEMSDGFFDLINKCCYRNQTEHACYKYYPNISVDKIDELVNTSLHAANSPWTKVAIQYEVWGVQYFADLYDQLLPRAIHSKVICHASNDRNVLNFMIKPMTNVFPLNACTIVSDTKEIPRHSLFPYIVYDTNQKMIADEISHIKKTTDINTKPGSYHSQDLIKNSDSLSDVLIKNPNALSLYALAIKNIPINDKSYKYLENDTPYILFFCCMCSIANENRYDALPTIPVQDTMSNYQNLKFTRGIDFLNGLEGDPIPDDDEVYNNPDPEVRIKFFMENLWAVKKDLQPPPNPAKLPNVGPIGYLMDVEQSYNIAIDAVNSIDKKVPVVKLKKDGTPQAKRGPKPGAKSKKRTEIEL